MKEMYGDLGMYQKATTAMWRMCFVFQFRLFLGHVGIMLRIGI